MESVDTSAPISVRLLQNELEATNREVLALTLELEDRVDERTAALRAAQKELQETNAELVHLALDLEARVAKRTEELQRARDQLEERVELRTHDLSQANEKLKDEILQRKKIEKSLRKAQQDALRASHAKGMFLAQMSHELRTPLNGVIGMIDLLLGTKLDAQQQRYAQLAKSSGDSLLNLISDILDLSKIEAGKLELQSIDFNLAVEVENALDVLAQRALAKGLEAACYVDPRVPTLVRGDADRLRQILVNLIGNAIKFTDKGAITLIVTAEELTDEYVVARFAVSDSGVGIPKERMDRLFQSFSQENASTAHLYGGTGLGLAISKQLAELMGGQIAVQSDVGRGSTFWFTARLQKAAAVNDPRRSSPMDPTGLRILAVDGNDSHLDILRQQIKSWGLEGETATDAAHAIQMLTEGVTSGLPYHVAIIDNSMPGMGGIELGKAIMARAELRKTVLMLMISTNNLVEIAQLKEAGFAGYIAKPVRQSQLFDKIMDVLPRPTELQKAEARRSRSLGAGGVPGAVTTTKGARILLVEDNEINQIVASELLEQSGYLFDTADNGAKAVAAVLKQPYDLVLMDCQMPEMDGFEATAAIRQAESDGRIKRACRLPIIALTANAFKGDRERCIEAGMDNYVSKPLRPDELIQVIEAHLKNARSGCTVPPESSPKRIGRPVPASELMSQSN